MKQFLLKTWFTMICLLIGAGSAWAETVKWTASSAGYVNADAVSTVKVNSNITINFDKGTNSNTPKYYASGSAVRVYGGNTITITSSNATITKVAYTFGNSDGSNEISANVGSFETPIWTGSANEICFSVGGTTGNRRISDIEITYSSGGPTPTTYNVTIDNNIANGTVTASSTTAAEGDEITLTATPANGYEFGSWNVTDASSNAITVTDNKFTMPAANVNVSATFNAKAARPENEIFYESFDQCTAIGGNDDIWSEISGGQDDLTPDNTGFWTFNRGYAANNCARFGTSSAGSYALLALKELKYEGDAILTFRAAAWTGDNTSLSISVSGGGKAYVESVTMKNSEWSTYTVRLFGLTVDSKIKFASAQASKNRFFLDEISVVKTEEVSPVKTLSSIAVSGTPTKTTYVEGDAFDPAGLIVTGTYSDASTETITEGITWNVTPKSLAAGTTSVSVTATVNGKTSAAYIVNGLTVNTIPEKTIADFIASEGGKCYLIGTVSNIVNTTFGNFDLTDESGTIYIYGCLTSEGVAQQFESLGIVAGDKIKVLANEYELYNEKNEAKNVTFVEKITVAPTTYSIEIDDEIANGTVEASAETAVAGATITLTATPADGYEFGEWCVLDGDANEVTVTNNQFTMPASDVLVSATFTEVQGGGDEPAGEYILTSVDKIGEEDEVVIVFTNSTASYAMTNDKGTSKPTVVEVTIVNNSLSNPASNILWNIVYNNDGTFNIYPNGVTNKWLYCINNNDGVRVGNTENNNVFSIDRSYLYNNGQNRYLGIYNSADVRSYLLNNDKIATNIANQTLAFYVKKAAPKVLASISLSGTYTTEFIQNQEFSHAGVVVTATYDDESTKVVTDKATFSEPDMTTVGTKTITVSYTEGEVTKTATYDITVAAEELTSIELGGTYTTNFEQNAAFNHDGLTVTAHYNSGRTADVTDEATVSTPDMSTLGEQTITVSYGDKEATYTIKVAGFYTVTIDNTHDTNGTISVWNGDVELASGALVLDGTKLTIKYEVTTEFYRFLNWQYKDNSVSKYTSKWKEFDYTIEGSDVSFRANFEEIPLHTITYYVNGVPTTEEVREGAALNFPANPTMAGKVFRGWIDKVKVDDSSQKPDFVTATTAQGNATFFAVFATETTTVGGTGSDVWEKVPHDFNAANLTKDDNTKYADWIADGNKYLIVYEASATQGYVFNGTGDDKDYKTVTITDGTIADDPSFVYITMDAVNTSHISFTVNGSVNDGKMMGDKKGDNGMNFYNFSELTTASDRAYANNDISTSNYSSYSGPYSGQWSVKSHGAYLRFYASSGSNYFRYYTNGAYGSPIEFYVKKAGTETTTTYSDFTTNMDVIERAEVKDKYFTICYPYAVHPKAYPGAKAYNIVGKTLSGDRIATLELEEVDADTPLEAGMPYFMVGDQTNFMGYHSLGNSVDEARNHNGLYGVFVDYAFKDDPNYKLNEYYVIYSNAVKAGSVNSGVKANRAFIKKSEVPDYVAPKESAARFVIELEEGTLTELDEVELKPIETSIYNLQGQRINRAEKGVYIVNGRKVIR